MYNNKEQIKSIVIKMKKRLKNILLFIRRLIRAFNSMIWCVFHNVKYHKGLYIERNVRIWGRPKLELSEYCRVGENTIFWGNGPIKIGNHSSIGQNSWIFSSKNGGVTIGNYVNSASALYIMDSDHQTKLGSLMMDQHSLISKPISIGDDVWLAYNVTILKGVTIGSGAVVGACSVVTKSVDNNAIVVGNPAKFLKYRS